MQRREALNTTNLHNLQNTKSTLKMFQFCIYAAGSSAGIQPDAKIPIKLVK